VAEPVLWFQHAMPTEPGAGPDRSPVPRGLKLAATALALGLMTSAGVLWLDADLPRTTPLVAERAEARSVSPALPMVPAVARGPRAERFAVELESFFTDADAERIERRLNHAGYQTVRFRQDLRGSSVYTVIVERMAGRPEANALLVTLRDAGLDGIVRVAGDGLSVRADATLALRGAVRLAQRLRTAGYEVRVLAEPGPAALFILRHGNFSSRPEAEQVGEALEHLGLPNQIVQLR
jgi:cell division septation protein DedD